MIIRPLLLLLTSSSLLQAQSAQPLQGTSMGMPSQVKYAGRYDVRTGTWERSSQQAARFSPLDTLYSNTALTGYFNLLLEPTTSYTIFDEGIIPASNDPTANPQGGMRDVSVIEEIQIGYCDMNGPGLGGWQLDFYEQYTPCSYPPDPQTHVLSVTLSGLPANGCWILDIVVPPTEIQHSGDGTSEGDLSVDSFGYSWSYNGDNTGVVSAGMMQAGNPVATDTNWMPVGGLIFPFTGSDTYYGEIGGCPGSGSGYANQDQFYIASQGPGALPSGCYNYGGYQNLTGTCALTSLTDPMGGHWLRLSGRAVDADRTISDPGCAGVPYATTGQPGELVVTGSADPADNDAVLCASALPLNEFGIFAAALSSSAPLPVGNGLLCLDLSGPGGVGRFGAANQIKNSGASGTMTLDSQAGEWDLSTIPTAVGTYAAVAGVTSHFQCWHRESGVGAGFNYTPSCSVTWQ